LKEKGIYPSKLGGEEYLNEKALYGIDSSHRPYKEAKDFLEDDSPDCLWKIVDLLLGHPIRGKMGQYVWIWHEYADSKGFEKDTN